MVIKIFSF